MPKPLKLDFCSLLALPLGGVRKAKDAKHVQISKFGISKPSQNYFKLNFYCMRFFILILMVGLLSSCDDTQKTDKEDTPVLTTEEKAENKRVEEVMKVHDDVMPKMANISRVRRQLKDYLENNPELDAEVVENINASVKNLDEADEGMMTWMADWADAQGELQKYKAAKDHKAVMSFLDIQMTGISKVRDDMLNSIEESEGLAKSLLNK